ncbi:MAG: cation:proton antiporter family protein [Waddliaceae bacterium]
MGDFFEIVHTSPFYELAALLALAAAIGVIGMFLHQPLIVSHIAVGILVGPSMLGIVGSQENIQQLSQLSIAVLLFLVGLKLDLNKIKTLGMVSLMTGLGQIAFTAVFGFVIIKALGFDYISSGYIAIALTFSSTIIIIKLLSDKHEVDSLHGRIAIGFLIVQDLFVVLTMMLLSAFGGDIQPSSSLDMLFKMAYALLTIAFVIVLMWAFIRYLATPFINRIIRSPELMITFAISWAALFAAAFDYFGFSKELGGLLAGISLASTPFRESIASRLSPLRDFLLLFFFIALGSQIDVGELEAQIFPSLVLSVFVLIGNPLIVLAIMGYMGYRKRTGFFAGLTVAQISEFSLIFIAMGISLGHITSESLGVVTLVGLITIATSIYMITYSHILYEWLEPFLGLFERKVAFKEEELDQQHSTPRNNDVIVFGLGRYGIALGINLKKANFNVLGIDYDPIAVKRWQSLGFDSLFGDVSDYESLMKLSLVGVKFVISAIPYNRMQLMQEDPQQVLIESLKRRNYGGKIVVSAQNYEESESLKGKGADMVILPFYDAAERAVEKLKEADQDSAKVSP